MTQCAYCGREMTIRRKRCLHGKLQTVDHIVPRSRMTNEEIPLGIMPTRWHEINTVRICATCNERKGNLDPLDWLVIMPEYGAEAFAARLYEMGIPSAYIRSAVAERARRNQ